MRGRIYSGDTTKAIDRLAVQRFGYDGFALMCAAGETAFAEISKLHPHPGRMLVLCGTGNNGGDGYIVGREALSNDWEVLFVSTGEPITSSAKKAIATVPSDHILKLKDDDAKVNVPQINECDVIVDALLGVGAKGAPRALSARLVELANASPASKWALDAPTGIDVNTGGAFTPCFRAEHTLTFIAHKFGLLTGAGRAACGKLKLSSLNLSPEVFADQEPLARFITEPKLRPRPLDSHKGDFGHLAIVGGDRGMLGATLLAGSAALRCGAGKVHIVSHKAHAERVAIYAPELMSANFKGFIDDKLKQVEVVAIGPGLGLKSWGRDAFEQLIQHASVRVIDADALTLLSQSSHRATSNRWVLTPHPGEAARLLGCSVTDIKADRRQAALQIAAKYRSVCVLKGVGSLIADATGSVFVCGAGNAGMASAGMGDVLTGMIAAFIAQGYDTLEASMIAVWLHATAADQCVARGNRLSLIASDVVRQLRKTIKEPS